MTDFNIKGNNNWGEYSKLVLNQLEKLEEGQKELKKDTEEKLGEISNKLTELTTVQRDINELKIWREKVQDVWSVSQMKESKDELYKQKNKWFIVIGILSAIQVVWIVFTFLKNNGIIK